MPLFVSEASIQKIKDHNLSCKQQLMSLAGQTAMFLSIPLEFNCCLEMCLKMCLFPYRNSTSSMYSAVQKYLTYFSSFALLSHLNDSDNLVNSQTWCLTWYGFLFIKCCQPG